MARYRKTEVGTWTDSKFRQLSSPEPNAQTLWFYLLTGPRTTIFPGIVLATEAVMADDLKWPLDAELNLWPDQSTPGGTPGGTRRGTRPRCLREAWGELSKTSMARADFSAGVVHLPRALFTSDQEVREASRPGSPNAFLGWSKFWKDIPDCTIKDEYLSELATLATTLGKLYVKAFHQGWGGVRGRVGGRVDDASRISYPLRTQDSGLRTQEQDPPERSASPRAELGVPSGFSRTEEPDPERAGPTTHPPEPILERDIRDADVQLVQDDFDRRFQARNGSPPTWGDRSLSAIRKLLHKRPIAEVMRHLRIAFESPPDFPPHPFDFCSFERNFDLFVKPQERCEKKPHRVGERVHRNEVPPVWE
jgi:hypothetical protein